MKFIKKYWVGIALGLAAFFFLKKKSGSGSNLHLSGDGSGFSADSSGSGDSGGSGAGSQDIGTSGTPSATNVSGSLPGSTPPVISAHVRPGLIGSASSGKPVSTGTVNSNVGGSPVGSAVTPVSSVGYASHIGIIAPHLIVKGK
jgi:hypothetical protein